MILFIGDGMGEAHVEAARMYGNGDVAPLSFEAFPVRGMQRTGNAQGAVTDSAAAATAMATGKKVDNGVISLGIPGEGEALPTVVEIARDRGKRTGLLTTGTPLTDATPAAFGAHEPSRGNHEAIAADYLTGTTPNVLCGPSAPGLSREAAEAAGYAFVDTAAAWRALDVVGRERVAGVFPTGEAPRLSEMLSKSLDLLEDDEDGFFVLVEHEGIDESAHGNHLDGVVRSVLELDEAVAAALQWAEDRDDTLIVVTGDHETGGLVVSEDAPEMGALPDAVFWTGSHTGVDVPVYATGPGSAALSGTYENTSLFEVLTDVE